MNLGRALGLRPLDRVQVGDAKAIREAGFDRISVNHQATSLPFWFFTSVATNGQLRLMSPGGYVHDVDAIDIVDIRRADPIRVRAMPQGTFLERLRLSVKDRQQAPGPDCYEPAMLLYAQRDRWGNFDYAVAFEDEALNTEGYCNRFAPLHDEDRRKIRTLTNRTRMPVRSTSSASWSADKGTQRAEEKARRHARAFVSAALLGDESAARNLLEIEI